MLPALYGLVMSAAVILGGALVGHLVDKSPRLQTMRYALVIENVAVLACAAITIPLLAQSNGGGHGAAFWILLVLLFVAAVVEELSSLAGTLAIERDWIVVICKDTPGVRRYFINRIAFNRAARSCLPKRMRECAASILPARSWLLWFVFCFSNGRTV